MEFLHQNTDFAPKDRYKYERNTTPPQNQTHRYRYDEIHAHIVRLTDPPVDHPIDAISVLDFDYLMKTDHFNNTLLHIEHHQSQEPLDQTL